MPTPSAPALGGLPLYALIDPLQGEPSLISMPPGRPPTYDALAQLRQQAWQRPVWISRDEHPLTEPTEVAYLVALEGVDDPLLGELVQAAELEARQALEMPQPQFTIGALIETALPGEALLERLERMWTVAPLGQREYARIADRRCFEMLAHLLAREELQQWLGPIARWHVLARSGAWVTHVGAADESLITSEEGWFTRASHLAQLRESRARLPRAAEFAQHVRLAAAHSLALTTLQHKQLPAHQWDQAHRTVWTALLHARRNLHLDHNSDLAAYAWRAVLQPHLLTWPAAVHAVHQARKTPETLEAALAALESAAAQSPAEPDALNR